MKGKPLRPDRKDETPLPGFTVLENPCIWMKAGVVNFRLCDADYDCFHCPFDAGMRKAMDAQYPAGRNGKSADWAADMRRKYPGPRKPCGYYLMGEKEAPRYCRRNYDCDDCPVEMALGYPYPERSVGVSTQRKKPVAGGTLKSSLRNECVWMKAGVVNFHLCTNNFDCYHCPFDFSLRAAMAPSQKPKKKAPLSGGVWEERVRDRYEPVPSPCIHYLRGETAAPAQCTRAFECYRCPVHEERTGKRPLIPSPLSRPQYRTVSGYRLAEGYYYHFGHGWVQILSGDCVRAGMDDFAARAFGPADTLDIAPAGASITQGGVGWILGRGAHRAPSQSPLTGKIIAVNEKAAARPELTHEDPYGEGWLFQIEPAFLKMEAETLFSSTEIDPWIENEKRALLHLMGPQYERMAATGGEPLDDLFGKVPVIGWDPLVRAVLRMEKKS